MGLDWEDIMLHAAAATVACGFLTWLFPQFAWTTAVLNALFWGIREAIQDVEKGNVPPWPVRLSSQKWAEFIAPTVMGAIIAAGASVHNCGEMACA